MQGEQALPSRPRDQRCGRAAVLVPLWIYALALFALPFLRSPDKPKWITYRAGDEDWQRHDPTRDPDRDRPYAIDVHDFDQAFADELGASLEEQIQRELEERFGMESPALRASRILEARRLPAGERMYVAECAGCHGLEGDGGGPAARHLDPRPRNFWRGLYKFTSTEPGQRPTHQDLHRTVARGLKGSSMPAFALLNDEQLWDIVEYVRWLALRGEFRQTMLDVAWADEELPDPDEIAEIVTGRWDPDRLLAVYPGSAEPPRDQESVKRGRALYLDASRASCFTCHGEGGRGDGPTAGDYHDDWGYPIRPRDFTRGIFRAGTEPKDLYQSIATGIGGTPMASFSGMLESREIWDLVHFVQSLSRPSR